MATDRSIAELRARETALVDKLTRVRAEIARREAKAEPKAEPVKPAPKKRSGTAGNTASGETKVKL